MGFYHNFFLWGVGRGGRVANRFKSSMFGRQASSCSFMIAINPLGKDFSQNKWSPKFDGENHFQTKSLKINTTKKKLVYLKCDKYSVKNKFEELIKYTQKKIWCKNVTPILWVTI
jgi:hypothetical protein